jgi:hypothetical protein
MLNMSHTSQESIDCALQRLTKIDFSLVRQKLASADHGHAWSGETIDQAQLQYEHFLALVQAYPDEALVPSPLADEFWHQHILDTRAYEHDSHHLFGFFLHHFPYLGIRSEADAELLRVCSERTAGLYSRHFGNTVAAGAYCSGGGGGSCSSCSQIDPRQFVS